MRSDYLETVHEDVFARSPSALLELFVLLQQHPQVRGVRTETIRAIGRSLWLIDEEFRQNPRHHRLFLEILRAPVGVTHELRRMNTYGVLGRYIPAFGRIVGRMQCDLFHAYTVDQHILMVLRNMRRFFIVEHAHEYRFCSQLAAGWDKPWVLYVAAIFHDIAKGRGGDHSDLGAKDASEQTLNINLFGIDGPGRYAIRGGDPNGSVAQLANYTQERFLAGSMMGYDLVVDVSVAQAEPTHIEATFSGTLTGNDSVTMKIEDGRFVYRE